MAGKARPAFPSISSCLGVSSSPSSSSGRGSIRASRAEIAMEITFCGAAREVTGSCHVVRVGNTAVALDFGMFQGRRAESNAKNLDLPFRPGDVHALLLSHAHIDHSGRLPML